MTRLRDAMTAVVAACLVGFGASQAPATSAVLDVPALLRDLQVLSSDAMQGREIDTEGGRKAREYLLTRFKAAGLAPFGASFEMPFAFSAGGRRADAVRHGVNLVGRLDGRRPGNAVIVVSAHYDHLGIKNGEIYNGADDNASGTAALVALAAYFHGHPTEHALIFAAFDGEEAGLRGSRAFVAQPPVPRAQLAVNVNMDMIGRDPRERLFAVGTFLRPFLRPYLERVAATAPVTLLLGHDDPTRKDVEDWTRDSDHWAFLEAGIPAVYLGDEDFDQHHRPTDDFETITDPFFVRAAETCLAVVKSFDANLEAIVAAR